MIRSLLGLLSFLGAVYFALSVPLGRKTLVQHLGAIGQTKEARDLVEGASTTVQPTLQAAKDRLLGEIARAPSQNGPVAPAPTKSSTSPSVGSPATTSTTSTTTQPSPSHPRGMPPVSDRPAVKDAGVVPIKQTPAAAAPVRTGHGPSPNKAAASPQTPSRSTKSAVPSASLKPATLPAASR